VATLPAAVAAPAARRLSRPALLAGAALALLGVVIVGGLAGGRSTGGPSPIALADIPADYLLAYEREAARYGIDWAILAAIGKIECDHGRSRAAGCNPPGTENGAGATGPMQFLGATWRRGTPSLIIPAVGPPTRTTIDGYAADGDGDGVADVWNPADAIAGAARLLRANGAPGDYRRAVFAYNHANWYVRQVLEVAAAYRSAVSTVATPQIGNPAAAVAAVLGNPRIQLTGVQRVDLASGLIDPRVVALLAWLGERHALVVTALRSDHPYLTTEGFVSNHAQGRAVDIGAVDGERCAGTRAGACGYLALQFEALSGVLAPTELIYCFDPDGPSDPNGFARGDHCDHVHVGYDG
jgi:Transglycosylase SLT domain